MIRQLLPISSLLLGSALLLMAGGINGLILPVRGSAEGFSAFSLGLLGTGWAIGYTSGCLLTPRLVGEVGHIRSFGVMASLAAVAILASLIFMTPWAWVPLRAISGFCFAGAAMIVESWLSERADAGSRGKVFGIYTMVNLLATTAGQMTLVAGDTNGHLFFVFGAILYCLALVPTAISSGQAPKPLVSVKLDLPSLWRNSPVAVFGAAMIGVSNSAFGTLAAVYAGGVGLALSSIALFTSLPILAGALSQIPVGILSDRIDRRKVLAGIAVAAVIADLAFVLLRPSSSAANLSLAVFFGATIYAMYPVLVAHANDHAAEGTHIQTSGGLLVVFGIGSIVGPLIAGLAMALAGARGLFMISILAHVALTAFTLWRISVRAPVRDAEKGSYAISPQARMSTPQTAAFAAEVDEEQNGSSHEERDD